MKSKIKNILIFSAFRKYFHRLYEWTVKWADSDNALLALFVLAFAESAFFPIPVDVLMIPICIADNKRSLLIATITLIGSLFGAYLGYLIGYAFFQSIGQSIFDFFSLNELMQDVIVQYNDNAFLALVTAGFTPIPFKVFTIVAGISKINLVTFTIATIIGRGGRFFLVGGLLRIFGDEIKELIEKYFDIFSIIFVLLLILGLVAIKFV